MKKLTKTTEIQAIINEMLKNESVMLVYNELASCDMSRDTPESIEDEFHDGLNIIHETFTSVFYNGKSLLEKVIDKDKDNMHSSLLDFENMSHIIVKY